jgi:O-antigen/teichoic acid export membrane protein
MPQSVPSSTARGNADHESATAASPARLRLGSSAMLASIAIMAAGGFIFNAIAARTVDVEVFGVFASLFFWVLLLNQLTSLGLPVTMSRLGRFSNRSSADWIVLRAFVLTVLSSLAGTLLFGLLAVPTLRPPVQDALFRYGVVVGLTTIFLLVSGLSLTLLVEIRLVSLGLARWVVWRALAANILRVALLVIVPLRSDPLGLLVINVGANGLLGALGAAWLIRHHARQDDSQRPAKAELAEEGRTALVNWATIAAIQAPQFAVPVLARLSSDSNAAFFLSWQVMTVVFLVPVAIGHVVVIESTGKSSRSTTRIVRLGVAGAALVAATCAVLAIPFGTAVSGLLFGDLYRSAGTLLPVLIAAAIPWSVTAVALAATRIDQRSMLNITIAAGFAVSTLGVALLIPQGNSMATARGWLIANVSAAVIAVVAMLVSTSRNVPERRTEWSHPSP